MSGLVTLISVNEASFLLTFSLMALNIFRSYQSLVHIEGIHFFLKFKSTQYFTERKGRCFSRAIDVFAYFFVGSIVVDNFEGHVCERSFECSKIT